MIKLKRAYEAPEKDDGFRILVDRLWPRGVSKKEAQLDLWTKEVAPSTELRKWFNHDPQKWDEFRQKYLAELTGNVAVEALVNAVKENRVVTVVYAAKDQEHNEAVVLKDYLEQIT